MMAEIECDGKKPSVQAISREAVVGPSETIRPTPLVEREEFRGDEIVQTTTVSEFWSRPGRPGVGKKIPRSRDRAGSSPASGTKMEAEHTFVRCFVGFPME